MTVNVCVVIVNVCVVTVNVCIVTIKVYIMTVKANIVYCDSKDQSVSIVTVNGSKDLYCRGRSRNKYDFFA